MVQHSYKGADEVHSDSQGEDDPYFCYVCNTREQPRRHEDPKYGAGERWAFCEMCQRWFHYGCSRFHNKTVQEFCDRPYCDACHGHLVKDHEPKQPDAP